MTPPVSVRLDQALVERGLAPSRARARALIEAGAVRLGGAVARRPSQKAPPDAPLDVIADPCPWVSRAGLKLDHALEAFGLTPEGLALDLGASTGGFTQVLLARGAEAVIAVEVGHGQMAPALQADARVDLREGVNARALPEGLPRPDWVTADLSFIGLETALPPALALARPGATLVALVKPQFEVGRARLGKGGVVRDPAARAEAAARIARFLETSGWRVLGETESPIEGGDGNREALIAARKAEDAA
ncbi:MAG: TlyA family RNA methyltransferase [Pseudomonadota bacterium]